VLVPLRLVGLLAYLALSWDENLKNKILEKVSLCPISTAVIDIKADK
jgi:hypothetical protein